MATAKMIEQKEAIERLREWIAPGSEVYTILRHVSRSGMSRSISVAGIEEEDGRRRIFDYDYNVARALGERIDRERGGVKVAGCGMDMGFHLVYSLSRTLFPDGFGCVGKECPSNDHSNGDRDYARHTKRRPHWHSDGGYAIRQRWL